MSTNYIPEGYNTITPYILAKDADKLIEFTKKAFGAVENYRMSTEDGKVSHAEVSIGNSKVMISEAKGDWPAFPGMFYLYMPDVDTVYNNAIEAGATSLREPTNEYYGDRSCGVADGFGNQWWIATHIEDVSVEEAEKRRKGMN